MTPGVSSCHYREVPPSISFSGAGFMATYQLGVAQSFLTYAPWILRTAPCVLGASAGSLVAAAVVFEMSLLTLRDEMLHFAKQMKSFTLGPFNPSVNVFNWLEYILHKRIPSDAHKLAAGRLSVSMTRMSDGKHIVMSEFQSKEDVVQALLCSCFVPVYCGILPPTFKGEYYVDGGFSSMQPMMPSPYSQTLTVSPFSGETDICPADTPCTWDMVVSGSTLKINMANSVRIINALYPMALDTLEQAYHSGYKDGIHFLVSNDLAPYLMIHNGPAPLNFSETKTQMNLEITMEEEKEAKVEKEAAPRIPFRRIQAGSSTDHKLTGIKEPPSSDMATNVLLGSAVTYLSMLGLPARILSHLLLPLTLSFYALLQSRKSYNSCAFRTGMHSHDQRGCFPAAKQTRSHWIKPIKLTLFFRQAPELLFWAWHGLRHFTFFFYRICVCTLKKNIHDRFLPAILLLQWLITAPSEAPSRLALRG